MGKKGMSTAIRIVVVIVILLLLALMLISVTSHNVNKLGKNTERINEKILGSDDSSNKGAIDKIIDNIMSGG